MLVSAFNQSSPTIAVRGATNTFTRIGANRPVAVVIDDLLHPLATAPQPAPRVPTAWNSGARCSRARKAALLAAT
ncbi:hypothetical protein ACRAWD_02850 [Caulobacter segnis]